MPATRLGSEDLLEYNARYGVLICRECQYAVQKNALQSHLLRHKIYRGERQRLLSSVAKYDILEPEQVPLPSPSSPPIDDLPIINGYRCTVAGCENLCASTKRMRRHWSEIHGFTGPLTISPSIAKPAKLQTFFRGTQIKYFEVTVSESVPLASSDYYEIAHELDDDDGHDGGDDLAAKTAPSPQHASSPVKLQSEAPLTSLDLEILSYFHHFITITSITLPVAEHQPPAAEYWQTDVVFQALRLPWLMYGLLSISAFHIAVLADNVNIAQSHAEYAVQYYSKFDAGLEDATKDDLGPTASGTHEVKKAGGRLKCMLLYAQWTLTETMTLQTSFPKAIATFELHVIMMTVQGLLIPRSTNLLSDRQSTRSYSNNTFDKARGVMENISSLTSDSYQNIPPLLFNGLRSLPFHISQTLGRPESPQDVFATLLAIDALIECCDISFKSDTLGAAWHGMLLWLVKVPDHFNNMIARNISASLLVSAHWAAILVQRTEKLNGWFVKGFEKMVLQKVVEQFPTEHSAALNLIRGLAGGKLDTV